jgi:hypothetical protein
MTDSLTFKPRRSCGWLSLLLLALVMLGSGVAMLGTTWNQGPILLVGVLILGLGVYFLALVAWFPTMRYELTGDALTLRYGPVLRYRIPLADIQTIRRRNLAISLWSSMRLPGLALFKVPYADVGTVKMCATAAATGILLVETGREKYGLTPADEAGLVAALEARLGR